MAGNFATDRELATDINLEETEAEPRDNKVSNAEHTLRPYMSDKEQVEQLKAKIARRLEGKFSITLIRTRSLLESSAKGFRFAVAVSRFHKQRDTYWYGYRPHHMQYLADSKNSFFVVGFLDNGRAFAVPVDIINSLKTNMNVTVPEGDEAKTIYHVHIGLQGNRASIYTQLNQKQHDITPYEI